MKHASLTVDRFKAEQVIAERAVAQLPRSGGVAEHCLADGNAGVGHVDRQLLIFTGKNLRQSGDRHTSTDRDGHVPGRDNR